MKGLRTDMAISENKTDTAVSVDKQVKGTLFDIQLSATYWAWCPDKHISRDVH